MSQQAGLRIAGSCASQEAVLFEDAVSALDADMAQSDRSDSHRGRCIATLRSAAAAMGWMRLADVTADSVTSWLTSLGVRNGAKTRNIKRAYLHRLGQLCVRRGWIERNPVAAVTSARVVRKVARRVPTEDEVRKLILAARTDWRKKDRWLVYLFAASTGLRWRTIKHVAWSHMKLDADPPHVDLPGELLKGREPQRVWLTAECAKALREHRGDAAKSGRVFLSVPKWDSFLRDVRKAGIDRGTVGETPTLSFHSLRHFASNRMLWAGAFTDQERAAQAGHATLAMTREVYTDPSAVGLGKKVQSLPPIIQGFTGSGQKSFAAHPEMLLNGRGASDSLLLSQQKSPMETTPTTSRIPTHARSIGPAVTSKGEGRDSSCFGAKTNASADSIGVGGFEPHTPDRHGHPENRGEAAADLLESIARFLRGGSMALALCLTLGRAIQNEHAKRTREPAPVAARPETPAPSPKAPEPVEDFCRRPR